MKNLTAITAIAFVTLAGCDYQTVKPVDPVAASASGAFTSTGRVTVTRIDMFRDSVAYGDLRGVYIIKDNETGIEYIGVSGIGIAETGSHQNGKQRRMDER